MKTKARSLPWAEHDARDLSSIFLISPDVGNSNWSATMPFAAAPRPMLRYEVAPDLRIERDRVLAAVPNYHFIENWPSLREGLDGHV
jgi:hypothetical protein